MRADLEAAEVADPHAGSRSARRAGRRRQQRPGQQRRQAERQRQGQQGQEERRRLTGSPSVSRTVRAARAAVRHSPRLEECPCSRCPAPSSTTSRAGRASAPALLLIPAGIATLRMWDEQVDALARRPLRRPTTTRAGSAAPATTSTVPFANHADALAVLDHLGVDRRRPWWARAAAERIALDVALECARPGCAASSRSGRGRAGSPTCPLTDEEQRRFDEIDAIDPAIDGRAPRAARDGRSGPWARSGSAATLDPAFVRRGPRAERAERRARGRRRHDAPARAAGLRAAAATSVRPRSSWSASTT